MYIRFVVSKIHRESEQELGLFHAAGYLADGGGLHFYEEERYKEIRKWFDNNLKKPDRFTAAKPPFYRKQARAISWFKDSASEHLSRMWEMSAILEGHGIPVRVLKSDRVGYIVYEDEHQIVAEPFNDTF